MLFRSGPGVALTLAALLSPLSSPAQDDRQDQIPVFRVEVNILPVDVIVTDEEGNFMAGLGVEDFELFENGEAREIQTFGLVELPLPVTAAPSEDMAPLVEPDYGVVTNEGTELGRLYVLVLDDLHVGAERTARVQALARRFVHDYLGPGYLMAVSFTSGRARGFTTSRSSLLGSIDEFMGKKLRSATFDRLEAQVQAQAAGSPVGDNSTALERGQTAAKTLRVLRAHCEWLKTIRGRRKAFIWISEGLDYDISNVLGQFRARTRRLSSGHPRYEPRR